MGSVAPYLAANRVTEIELSICRPRCHSLSARSTFLATLLQQHDHTFMRGRRRKRGKDSASKFVVGAVLTQEGQAVIYFSKKLSLTQSNALQVKLNR